MELEFMIIHHVSFEEFYKNRERKWMLKSTARKAYNEIVKGAPNNEWIIHYKFYDTHIEMVSGDETAALEYQQYNGVLDLPQCYFLHNFGNNELAVNKSEFVFGDVKEFPYFISRVINQIAPSQLIFPKDTDRVQ